MCSDICLIKKINVIHIFAYVMIFALILIGCNNSEEDKETSKPVEPITEQDQIVEKGLVILIKYPDVKHTIDTKFVQNKFSQLNDYIKEMSYNKVSINIDITEKWYEMPQPVKSYEISPRNLEVDDSRVELLIKDALNSADNDVDYSKYDFVTIFMSAQRQEYGMIGLCGYPGMLGWTSKDILKTGNGEAIKGGVAIFSFQAHVGTLFHDTAHILGGVKDSKRMVPCLYDHDLQAQPGDLRDVAIKSTINMGFWDPMSCHYIEPNLPPPGISSWTKMRLGWLEQSKIRIVHPGETAEIQLGPLESDTSDVLAIKIPISNTKYYLIENRQPIGGYDKYLPGSGVLIMYADDQIPECRHGKAPVKLINADPGTPNLEAAEFDVGKKNLFTDDTNKLKIQIAEKIGSSYKIVVSFGK